MTQKQTQAKTLLAALENYYPSYFGSDKPISNNFKIQNKVYPKKWVLDETFKLAEIPQDSSDIGVAIRKLEEIYASSATETPSPEYVSNTTLTPEQLKDLGEQAENRTQQKADIQAREKQTVEDFITKNQERIARSKAAQVEIAKLKPLSIKIEEIEKVELSSDERVVFEEYKKEAIENPEETSVKLARELHTTIDPILKEQGLPQEEIDLVINKTAQRTVENLVESAKPDYVPPAVHVAINNAVFEKIPTTLTQNAEETIKTAISTTSVHRFQPDLFYKNIIETHFNKNIASAVFGADPTKYSVSVSEIPTQGYSYKYNFAQINDEGRMIQEGQNQTLQTLKGLGQQEAKSFLYDQSATYFAKSSLGQKLLIPNSKAEMLFYSTFKGVGKTVTWTGSNFVGNAVLRFAPEYAPILNIATGTRFVTPVVSIASAGIGASIASGAAATTTQIAITGGIMASEAFAGGAGGAAAGAAAGSVVPVVGTIVGAVTGFVAGIVGGKFVSNALSKLKTWWTRNKDSLGPALAIGAGVGGMMVFGPVGGLIAGGLVLAGTGGLAAFAFGAFNLFGFIGRSIGVAIATPVIVTLLVLPPLVAFIMLVINNSAYIVPPASPSSDSSQVITSPYIDVVKTPSPPGPFENNELPLTVEYTVEIKAKKGNLSNVKIGYECSVIKKNGSATCPKSDPTIPTTVADGISPTNSFKFTYKQTYSALGYVDSFVTDVITVTADVVEQSGVTAAGSATIKIGDPPEDCPSIWPTNHGYLTQGARTPASCGNNCSHSVLEAIDIGVVNVGVSATHTGTIVTAQRDSCLGNHIQIKSTCNGKDFISRYAHLEGISVRVGQLVTMGQNIGLSGNTGSCTTGSHLHYEFRYWPDGKPSYPGNPPFMMKPFLPENVKRGCKDTAECGVSY